LQAEFIL